MPLQTCSVNRAVEFKAVREEKLVLLERFEFAARSTSGQQNHQVRFFCIDDDVTVCCSRGKSFLLVSRPISLARFDASMSENAASEVPYYFEISAVSRLDSPLISISIEELI